MKHNADAKTKKISELNTTRLNEFKTEIETLISGQKADIETENTKKIGELKTEIEILHETQMNQLKTEMVTLNSEKISELRTEMETQIANQMDEMKKEIEKHHTRIVMLRRKEVGNPVDFFEKTFSEYQAGFEANGESWIGLDTLHQLTSQNSYKLKITMTDYDQKKYVAVYDQFKVGPGDGYVLTVGGFNDALSTLGDSMAYHNGMMFSAKDRDQDARSGNCVEDMNGGGWWYKSCYHAHPTGQHSSVKKGGNNYIRYDRSDRGHSGYSWSEAEFLLVPII